MANSDKNIVITPNIGSTSDDPKIVFSGADSSTSAQDITIKAYPVSNGTLSIEGSAGQLFSVTNSLSGTLFSVNDVSGIPSIEVLDDGTIKLAEYGGNIIFNESGANVDFRVEGDTDANLLFVDASTDRVGIGTNAPDALLTVDGIASFGAGAAATPSIAASGDLNTGMFFPAADTIAFSKAGTEAMRILNNGNVGIGTSNAQEKLNVIGSIRGDGLAGDPNYGFLFKARYDGATPLELQGNLSGGGWGIQNFLDWGVNGLRLFAPFKTGTNTPMIFSTSNTERMRIDSSGNLLLNTTSQVSSAKLSVLGGIGLDRTSTYNQQWYQFISHTGTSNYGTLNFSPLNGQTTAGFRINDSSNNARLVIRGLGDSNESVFNYNGADIDFRVRSSNNLNTLFVDGGTDRVGIGTSSPSSILDVNGTVTATAFVGDGSALTGVGTTISNDANNRIITADGSGGLNAEANLNFDGSDLTVTGDITTTGFATALILQNPITYSGSITIDTDRNAMVAGPFTVTGTLTIPNGSTFVVV